MNVNPARHHELQTSATRCSVKATNRHEPRDLDGARSRSTALRPWANNASENREDLLHPLPAGNIRHREVPHGSRHHQTCAKAFITEMKSQRQTTKAQEIESYTTTTKLKLQHSPMILTSGGCKLFRKHLNAGKLLHGLLRSASCQHCHFGIDLTCEALGLRPSRSPILGVWANGH